MSRVHATTFGRMGLGVALLCSLALSTIVLAGEKRYPLEGSVTALGTNQEATGSDKTLFTHTHRTYTVRTPSRVFVLQCPNDIDNLLGAKECGGRKQIAIGDTIHLRVEKRYAYVQTDKGKEQRLTVLSEGMSDDSAQAAKP